MALPVPCPCENESPQDAPGKIEDAEEIIRVITKRSDVDGDEQTGFVLTASHWVGNDIKGRKGTERRNASIMRASTPLDDLEKRVRAMNRVQEWASDPLIAISAVAPLRKIANADGHREICINADPLDDQHGHCATHGGIVRSEPGGDPNDQRTQMTTIKESLCDCFSVIRLSAFLASKQTPVSNGAAP